MQRGNGIAKTCGPQQIDKNFVEWCGMARALRPLLPQHATIPHASTRDNGQRIIPLFLPCHPATPQWSITIKDTHPLTLEEKTRRVLS